MLFGIPALLLTGIGWTLIGIVMGAAPRRGLRTDIIQFFSAVASVAVSTIILCAMPLPETAWTVRMLTCGAYFCGGLLNFTMLQFMSHAMERGPNGIIWSLVQSALLMPFLTGVIFFGNTLTLARLSGLGMLLAAILLLGALKDNRQSGRGWRLPTFIAFLLAGIVLNLNNLPSYFREADSVTSVMRSLSAASGTLTAAFCRIACRHVRGQGIPANTFRNIHLWKFAVILSILHKASSPHGWSRRTPASGFYIFSPILQWFLPEYT